MYINAHIIYMACNNARLCEIKKIFNACQEWGNREMKLQISTRKDASTLLLSYCKEFIGVYIYQNMKLYT